MKAAPSLGLIVMLLAASCSSTQPNVKIRSTPQASQPLGIEAAEGHLALGNVGLALEGFRKAIREQPRNVRAIVGIAHSYERMGRFDLSGRWFETALAADPTGSAILLDFAASLERQGQVTEALSLRAEAVKHSQTSPVALSTAREAKEVEIATARVATTVTLSLPPPRSLEQLQHHHAAPSPGGSSKLEMPSHPRLERLSLGEVALITKAEPIWRAELVKSSAQSATFRFVAARPVARLLNAARTEGLAARTRAQLFERGWKRIEIGDAPAVREETLVLFPSSQKHVARRLAAYFGFSELRPFESPQIVVLLGRDAARLKALQPA